MNIVQNITSASLGSFAVMGWMQNHKEEYAAKKHADNLDIRAHSFDQEVVTLSGGNQQKVVLAKWLLRKPRLLVMNDPTRGIDVAAKAEIYRLVRKLAGAGSAILFISSEVEELVGVCDRVLVMREGCLVAEFAGNELTAHKVMETCYGG